MPVSETDEMNYPDYQEYPEYQTFSNKSQAYCNKYAMQ